MGQTGSQTTTTQVQPDPFAQQSGQQLFNAANTYLNQFGNQQVAGMQPFSAAAQNYLAQGLLGYNPGFQMPSYGPSPRMMVGDQGLRGYAQDYDPLGGGEVAREGEVTIGPDGLPTYGPSGGGGALNTAEQIATNVGGYRPQQISATDVRAPTVGDPNRIAIPSYSGPGDVTVAGPAAPQNVTAPTAQTPANVTAQQVTAPTAVAPANVQAQQIQAPGNVGYQEIAPGTFLGGPGIGAYQNPYNDLVVGTVLSDIERSRQLANTSGARSASASTYGGDRNALVEAETNRGFADQAARTAAQLRSQGFDTAAGLMGQDLQRGLQAGLANQGAGIQTGLANAGFGLDAARLNQQAALQAGLANQGVGAQFGLANASNALRAGLANQDASLRAGLANQGIGADMGRFNASNMFQAALANQNAMQRFGEFGSNLGLQAALANQATRQDTGMFNANLSVDAQAQNIANQMQANQFNASNFLQAALANQGAGLDAARLNQQAGLQGAGLNLNAANALAGIGGQRFGQLLGGANALNQFGLQNQALAQQYIDQPLNNISYLNSLLQGVPFGGQSTTQTLPPGSQGSGIAGGALAGAGVGSTFGPWGAGIGAVGGGLLGWLG